MNKIPRRIVHYSKNDPRVVTGGVETFGRALELIFEEVEYMTPRDWNVDMVRSDRIPVICDNQMTLDWPKDIPVIGFQHGVAAVKARAARSPGRLLLARRQKRAASRPNTTWVACAQWVSERFGELYGNRADHIIYYPVDVHQFDGIGSGKSSRLVLHDARLVHKGSRLLPTLQDAFPEWDFQFLNCAPEEVADRMRTARAFVHLSQYEGNSLVCNEAMAMNLPCLFTRVGLMRDIKAPTDVFVIEMEPAFKDRDYLVRETGAFLESLNSRSYEPRRWVLENATIEKATEGWSRVIADFDERRA